MNKSTIKAGKWLFILAVACLSQTAKAQSNDSAKAKTQTVAFIATEMGCATDSKMVETALYRKKGVKSVIISGDTITVVYNPAKLKPEDLQAVIENTGTCEDPDARVHKATRKQD